MAGERLERDAVAGMEDASEQPGGIMVEFVEPDTQFGQEGSVEGELLLYCGGGERGSSR